jgi:fatty acid desaturase
MTLVTGALNHQTAHHLFPGIAQCYYPIVTPIVKQTCEEFSVDYNCVGSVWEAIWLHVIHLKKLGRHGKSINGQCVSVSDKKLH